MLLAAATVVSLIFLSNGATPLYELGGSLAGVFYNASGKTHAVSVPFVLFGGILFWWFGRKPKGDR